MSNFKKFKSNSYCVGGGDYIGAINIFGFISATKMLKIFVANVKETSLSQYLIQQ